MSQKDYFNNVNDENAGIKRKLGEGISTRIFCGDQAMLSIVTIGSFLLIWSPGLTKTSITSTSLKSPISGTEIFWVIISYYKLVGTY